MWVATGEQEESVEHPACEALLYRLLQSGTRREISMPMQRSDETD